MRLSEYAAYDGVGLIGLLRSGEVGVEEVTAAAYEAIERVNPLINAVVESYDPTSLHPVADDALLAGVPSLRKDIHDEAGRQVSYASRLTNGVVATSSQPSVQRMQDLGIRFIGRSATSEFAMYATTESRLFGDTRNPWDLTRSVGGSSGGAAAAVAAGVVPFADASDAGGSIRIPAACCGLVGLKTTRPVVAVASEPAHLNGNVELVVARTVRDVSLMAGLVDGVRRTSDSPSVAETLRIALSVDPWAPRTSLDSEIIAAVLGVASALDRPTRVIESATPVYDVEAYWDAILVRLAGDLYRQTRQWSRHLGRPLSPDLLEPVTWQYVELGRRITADDVRRAYVQRDSVVEQMHRFFEHFDVLITPTLQVLTPLIGTAGGEVEVTSAREHFLLAEEVSPNLAVFNMTGHPAISVPAALSRTGLPIGVQLVGRHGSDDVLLALAAELEERFRWQHRIPPVHVSRMGS